MEELQCTSHASHYVIKILEFHEIWSEHYKLLCDWIRMPSFVCNLSDGILFFVNLSIIHLFKTGSMHVHRLPLYNVHISKFRIFMHFASNPYRLHVGREMIWFSTYNLFNVMIIVPLLTLCLSNKLLRRTKCWALELCHGLQKYSYILYM